MVIFYLPFIYPYQNPKDVWMLSWTPSLLFGSAGPAAVLVEEGAAPREQGSG